MRGSNVSQKLWLLAPPSILMMSVPAPEADFEGTSGPLPPPQCVAREAKSAFAPQPQCSRKNCWKSPFSLKIVRKMLFFLKFFNTSGCPPNGRFDPLPFLDFWSLWCYHFLKSGEKCNESEKYFKIGRGAESAEKNRESGFFRQIWVSVMKPVCDFDVPVMLPFLKIFGHPL